MGSAAQKDGGAVRFQSMMVPVDYVQLALASTRRAFINASPFTFIVSDGTLARASGPHYSVSDLAAMEKHLVGGRTFLALPLRKATDTFPQMITVGRTANNDLVIPDSSISTVHAIFMQTARGFELADVGSKNGTSAAGEPLPPRGAAHLIKLGERLRFGRIEFTVVDAGSCWDTVDRMRRSFRA
jgi:hypothetical protein